MITPVRGTIRDEYDGILEFSRPSVAYDAQGRRYDPGQARFEPGRHGMAVRVEEGTVNLLANPLLRGATDTLKPTLWSEAFNALGRTYKRHSNVLRIEITDGDAAGIYCGINQVVPVTPQTIVSWGILLASNAPQARFLLSDGETLTSIESKTFVPTKVLTPYTISVKVPAGVTTMRFLIVMFRSSSENAQVGDYLELSHPIVE